MKFMLLLYGSEKAWDSADEEQTAALIEQHERFTQMLIARNALVGGEALTETSTAKTVRNADTSVTDGPFAETTEQLGGFYLIEAADMDEALEIAKQVPEPTVEVRPVMEMP
jgi:hypothetical protein